MLRHVAELPDDIEEALVLGTTADGDAEVAPERIRRAEGARHDSGSQQRFRGAFRCLVVADSNQQEVRGASPGQPTELLEAIPQPLALISQLSNVVEGIVRGLQCRRREVSGDGYT